LRHLISQQEDSNTQLREHLAREISQIINTFFTRETHRQILKSIEHYYAVIRRQAQNIANHHEKQTLPRKAKVY